MDRRDVEERAAKCNICAGELSIIENLLYGNRCVFCSGHAITIRLWEFLILCWLDYRIYKLTHRLLHKSGAEDGRMLFLGCISEAGGMDIRDIQDSYKKLTLIKILKRYV